MVGGSLEGSALVGGSESLVVGGSLEGSALEGSGRRLIRRKVGSLEGR